MQVLKARRVTLAASAIVATGGKGHDYSCGRQFWAWLGLVPGQYSAGGKQRLGRITKMGDRYLRKLLFVGMMSLVKCAKRAPESVAATGDANAKHRGRHASPQKYSIPKPNSPTSSSFYNCSAICDESDYRLGGSFFDGKGQPSQVSAVSHGSSTARFNGINVINTARSLG